MTAKLSELSGQMKRLTEATGEHPMILLSEIVTSLDIIDNFAVNLIRQENKGE